MVEVVQVRPRHIAHDHVVAQVLLKHVLRQIARVEVVMLHTDQVAHMSKLIHLLSQELVVELVVLVIGQMLSQHELVLVSLHQLAHLVARLPQLEGHAFNLLRLPDDQLAVADLPQRGTHGGNYST